MFNLAMLEDDEMNRDSEDELLRDGNSDSSQEKTMGSDINLCILSGTLDVMPKIITTQNNTQGIALSLAVQRTIKDKLTQDFKEHTSWYNLVSYNESVVQVGSKLKKGQKVLAQGSLSVRSWMDQSGQKRIRYELNMEKLQLLSGSSNSNMSTAFDMSNDVEDGLPF